MTIVGYIYIYLFEKDDVRKFRKPKVFRRDKTSI